MLAQHAAEGMGADYEPAFGPGRAAKFRGLVKTGLVPVQAKGQHMAHIGIGFHRPNQNYVVAAGESLKLVPVPGAAVFGNAKAPESQPFPLPESGLRAKGCCRRFPWWCVYAGQICEPCDPDCIRAGRGSQCLIVSCTGQSRVMVDSPFPSFLRKQKLKDTLNKSLSSSAFTRRSCAGRNLKGCGHRFLLSQERRVGGEQHKYGLIQRFPKTLWTEVPAKAGTTDSFQS